MKDDTISKQLLSINDLLREIETNSINNLKILLEKTNNIREIIDELLKNSERKWVKNIYERITLKILSYLDKMKDDEEFKKTCPNVTPQEYLIAKANPDIKPQRLINILNGKVKRITLAELVVISRVLRIELVDLFKDNEEVE